MVRSTTQVGAAQVGPAHITSRQICHAHHGVSEVRPSRKAAVAIVCIWIASIATAGWLAYRYFALDDVHHLH
jgi:hypothetical protein